MKNYWLLIVFLSIGKGNGFAQSLKPGFNFTEIKELLSISERTCWVYSPKKVDYGTKAPIKYQLHYRSPEMGLANLWELWTSDDNSVVISIRGTTESEDSWMANLYAAMVPAKGDLTLSGKECFHYELSQDPKAAIHVGWLIGMGFLSLDILPKIDSCYKAGVRNFYITGHSQGGAIAYLLTSHLLNLRLTYQIPADITFKTYAIASPKPGNLYFAYSYEASTWDGWSYNLVNSSDWVPEAPISIQTLDDFNATNPFDYAKSIINKERFPRNLILRGVYLRIEQPNKKAKRYYERYLSDLLATQIEKKLEGLRVENYFHSAYFVRAGVSVSLVPKEPYYAKFPEHSDDIFMHHHHETYAYLLEQLEQHDSLKP